MVHIEKPPNMLLRVASVLRTGPFPLSWRLYDLLHRLIRGFPAWRLAKVTPNLYVGGQHYPKGWQNFRKEGITAIVNMREEEYDDAKNGIATDKYLHLPTIDNTPPTLEMLQQGADFIAEEINNGGKVYIHCKVGVGRASTMAIAYLITQGMTRDEAIAKIKKVRPFIHPTWRQLDRLAEFEEMLRNQSNTNL